MTAYVAATAAGASPTTWDAETHGLIDVDASKASAWGPGSRTLVFPGASSYVESAWLYAQEFESLSMTVWSLLSVHLANGVLAPADFPTRLSKLYRSSFAFGVAGYYLKHMHMDIAGAVDAMELHRGQGYDFHAYCKAALGSDPTGMSVVDVDIPVAWAMSICFVQCGLQHWLHQRA